MNPVVDLCGDRAATRPAPPRGLDLSTSKIGVVLLVPLTALGNIRETVKYVNGSTSRKEKFKLIAQQVNASNLSLKADVPTRWNSTFLMLERAVKFRDAFDRLHECDSSYKFLHSKED